MEGGLARSKIYRSGEPSNNLNQEINNQTELPLPYLGASANYFKGGIEGNNEDVQNRHMELNVPLVLNHRLFNNEGDDIGQVDKVFTLQRLPAQPHQGSCCRNIWLFIGIAAGVVIFTIGKQYAPILVFFLTSLICIVAYLAGGTATICSEVPYELKNSSNVQELYKDQGGASIQFNHYVIRWIQLDQGQSKSIVSVESHNVLLAKQSDRSPRLPPSLLEQSDKKYLLFDVKVFYYFQDAASQRKINEQYQEYKRQKPAVEEPQANEFQRRIKVSLPAKIMISNLRSAPWLRYLRVVFFHLGLQYFFLRIMEGWTQRYTLFIVKQIRA